MSNKLFIPCIYLYDGQPVKSCSDFTCEGVLEDYVQALANMGADQILMFDLSKEDAEHEKNILAMREINRMIDIPSIATGNIKRLEDVKKYIYTGAKSVALQLELQTNVDLIEEASKRFGKDKLLAIATAAEQVKNHTKQIGEFLSSVIYTFDYKTAQVENVPAIIFADNCNLAEMTDYLAGETVTAITGPSVNAADLTEAKLLCKEKGIPVNIFESSLSWEDFKLNSDGHLTVVVQDYKTDEVLMVAYMNKEAFDLTVKTGRMTYYSRSRDELWIKGDTSGHYQYVRSLTIDCDQDTLLAKVHQIGAACHTGNKSCFFREIVHTEYQETNPLKVFEDVYRVILDRKENPKEGSYTNYLFDKGIDKILKKVGEEATEIVIAAKNPDHEEVKYEIADFLYHVMVLMAECDLSWEDITTELANR